MGNSQSLETYSEPIPGTEQAGYTPVFRNKRFPHMVVSRFGDLKNARECFLAGLRQAEDKPCLGHREILSDGTLGQYVWQTYAEVNELALSFGAGLASENCCPEIDFPQDEFQKQYRFLAIYSHNCPEWTIAEEACHAHGITLIPLYDTLGASSTEYIINETHLNSIVASSTCAISLLKRLASTSTDPAESITCESLRVLVVIGDVTPEMRETAKDTQVKIFSFDEMVSIGRPHKSKPLPDVKPDHVNTICFTSGTTGTPKGVILTQKNFTAVVVGAVEGHLSRPDLRLSNSDVSFSFLPLAHVYERAFSMVFKTLAGRIGFFSGDVKNLVDDMKALQPTVICVVPRVLNRIRDRVYAGISQKGGVARALFKKGLEMKTASISATGKPHHSFWDAILFRKTAALTGGKLRYIVCGSAPLDSQVQLEMRALLCVPIIQGYGLTESFAASIVAYPLDPENGTIGSPLPCTNVRLQSVPEMEYFATVEEAREFEAKNGKPIVMNNGKFVPRGEMQMRGGSIFEGYFMNPKMTAEMKEGEWLKTGDVGEVDLHRGGFKIIDRKKNIFKLSQGEYVAPDKLESLYSQLPSIEQIFVHGESTENYLVALVLPDMEWARTFCTGKGLSAPEKYADVQNNDILKAELLKQISEHARTTKLAGFEVVKKVEILTEPFSIDNGFLSPSFKMKRFEVIKTYGPKLLALYQ